VWHDSSYASIKKDFIDSGKIRFAYLNYPLPQHPHAWPAAEVAMCSGAQGKFWPVHDALCQRQTRGAEQPDPTPYLIALADSAGVQHDPLVRCVTAHATRAAIDVDAAAAVRSGARSTPTFYIEGWLIDGAAPLPVFREVLDSIYQSKTGPTR
jgi:protein-disulfide isomerase